MPLDELDHAVRDGEDGVVAAEAHALAGVELGASLANDDVARDDRLAGELLHAEALADGVAAVARRSLSFFMCHYLLSPSGLASAFAEDSLLLDEDFDILILVTSIFESCCL